MKLKFLVFLFSSLINVSTLYSSTDNHSKELLLFETGPWVLYQQDFLYGEKVDSTQFLIQHRDAKSKKESPYYSDVDLWYFFNSDEASQKRLQKSPDREPSKKVREELFVASLNATLKNKALIKKELNNKKKKNDRDQWLLKNYLK